MFEKLKDTVEKFDLLNLLITNSACQMMPVNANKLQRFEAMAFCICSCPYDDSKPAMSKSRIKSIYNSNLYGLEQVSVYEDPFEQMFTESITFYGGTYTVFPGITETGALIVKQLLKAIFLSERKPEFQEFYKKVYDIVILFLSISNSMAVKACLNYGEGSKVIDADIRIPPFNIEERLFNAVLFDINELAEILNKRGVNIGIIDDFIVDFGEADINEYTSDNHILHHKPFLLHEDQIVVTMPCNLLGTLRHSIINLAMEYGFENELKIRFQDALWNTTIKYLNIMNIEQNRIPFLKTENEYSFKEGVFSIDSDKVMYVQLHTDDFADYDARFVYDVNTMFQDEFEIRALEWKKYLMENHKGIKSVFFLLLLQPAGRAMGLGLNKLSDELHLIMSLKDLEVVALLEGGDPLHLFKYAKVKQKVGSKMVSMGFLDTYSIYKSNDKSFYFSDDIKPTMFYFPVGEGRDIIEEMYRKVRPHGVQYSNNKGTVEVVSVYSDDTIPIYAPLSPIRNKIAMVVEGEFWKIWISGSQIHPIMMQFVELISYWVWQLSQEMNKVIRKEEILEIKINLYPFENWTQNNFVVSDRGSNNYPLTYSVSENVILLNVHHDFSFELQGYTNQGERELIKTILLAIGELTGIIVSKPVNEVLDNIAPIGPKKKLLVFNQENFPVLLEPGDFPTLRYIDATDENLILDEIGLWLRQEKGLNTGSVSDQKRVINDVVGYLFSKIEEIIQTLKDPEEILQNLMLHYEALLQKREEHRVTIPTTLHCFFDKTSMIKKIKEDTSKFNKLSVSLRFLIEYVSACPPKAGEDVFSMEISDYLLALSSLLIEWANNSDLINYQLADLQISMLPSERLGIAHDNDYFSASSTYFRQYSSQALNNAIDTYESDWEVKGESNVDDIDSDIIEAFQEEFGVGFFDYMNLISNIIDYGRDIPEEVKSVPYEELVRLLKSTGLDEAVIEYSLSLMSLKERDKFLEAPKEFKKEDVLPWKFNRELSYLRRPLVVQKDIVYWSNRHLYYSGQRLIELCVGGRLKAKSKKMKNLISKYQNIKGEKFNNSVENLFSPYDFLITRGQVKKIGGKRIEGDKGDLGDIDVLVINPKSKRVYTLECKDLSIARNPYEVHHELNNLFVGTKKKPSIAEKHSKRTEWIKDNLDLVLEHYGVAKKGKWKVISLIIIDEEMISPYLYKGNEGMRVLSINKLKEELEKGNFLRK